MSTVVVIGGGLGGTASAARLAKLGHEVTLIESSDRLGGAIGLTSRDGFTWDSGPGSTLLPAVLRDLFRKSGRPLERELDLVPSPPRRHLFADGTVLDLPTGSRAAQIEAVDAALGAGAGPAWVDHLHRFADTWAVLRTEYIERPFDPDHLSNQARRLLRDRSSLRRHVDRTFHDDRLRRLATYQVVLDGHDPREVPAWVGLLSYLEQSFGVWTVPGGLGRLSTALAGRLEQRGVALVTATAHDIVLRHGRAAAVATSSGSIDADVVVCAIDPRRLPTLAPLTAKTMPVVPAPVTHLGLVGDVPPLPPEVVVHAKDATLLLRTGGTAPPGAAAWTLLGRGRLPEDLVGALAGAGLRGVRRLIETRIDLSPGEQLERCGGSPYGVLWQGRSTVRDRLPTRTPYAGVYCAGASVAATTGLPFVGLTAAVVAEQIGPA